MKFRTTPLFLLSVLATSASAQQVYMSGLANPRGLVFGNDGTLYVAEAGSGGGNAGPVFTGGGGSLSYGLSGGVSTRLGSGAQARPLTNLPSLADPATGAEATGPADLTFTPGGNLAVLFGLGAGSTARATLPSSAAVLGTLASYNTSTGLTVLRDYALREQNTNPDGNNEINSNPYSVVRDGTGYAVADGGANVLWRDGGVTVLPPQLVPFGPGQIPQDSVPTSVIARNGGGFLVGSLGGFPFTQGASRIFTVGADGTLLGSDKYGLTSIIDLAYAPDGSLLVEEIAANGLMAGGPGDVKRIRLDGTVDTIISGLITPTSMAFGPDGFLYVTNNALSGSDGQVLRYAYSPVPEPAPLAALGLGALALLRRRKR